MTPVTAATCSRVFMQGAVIAAQIFSRFLNSLSTQLAQAWDTPANDITDVRALANSLPYKDLNLAAELLSPVGRPFPSRYLPAL